MSITEKMINIISEHPKLLTLALGLTVAVSVGTAIGMLNQSHMAYAISSGDNSGSSTLGHT
jgi:hypothetical protein